MLPSLSGLALHDATGGPGDGSNVGDRGQPFARAPSASFGPGRARVRDTHTALEHAQRNAREQQENAQRLTAQLQTAQENEQATREQAELDTRELERQRGSLRLRLQKLQQQLADRNSLSNQQIKEMERALAMAQADLAERDLEIAGYSAQVGAANEARGTLQAELDDLRRVVQEAQVARRPEEAEPAWLQEAADVLAATDSLQGTVDALTRENSALQSRLDELRRTQSLDRNVCDGLRTQIDGLRDTFTAELARAAAAAAPPAAAPVPQGPPIPTEPAGQAEALYNAVLNQKVDRVRQLLAIDPPLEYKGAPSRRKDTPYYIWSTFKEKTSKGETKTFEKASEILDLFAAHGYKYATRSNFHIDESGDVIEKYYSGDWFLGTSDKAKIVRRMIELDMFGDAGHFTIDRTRGGGATPALIATLQKQCSGLSALPEGPVRNKLAMQMLYYHSDHIRPWEKRGEQFPNYYAKGGKFEGLLKCVSAEVWIAAFAYVERRRDYYAKLPIAALGNLAAINSIVVPAIRTVLYEQALDARLAEACDKFIWAITRPEQTYQPGQAAQQRAANKASTISKYP